IDKETRKKQRRDSQTSKRGAEAGDRSKQVGGRSRDDEHEQCTALLSRARSRNGEKRTVQNGDRQRTTKRLEGNELARGPLYGRERKHGWRTDGCSLQRH